MVFLDTMLPYIKDGIAAIGILVIVGGAVRSVLQLLLCAFYRIYDINAIRFEFGNCVILGLEFMVAADIVGSMIEPDYYNLGLLGLLVLIRTILSYFLSLELETLTQDPQL
jgi:uncharacterized membrane protein